MEQRGIKKMLLLETILYGVRALVIGIPVSILLSFLMFNTIENKIFAFELNYPMYFMMVIAVFVILLGSKHYNDLYDTAYGTAYRIKTGHEVDRLSYGEFYSCRLFDKIKSDIGYDEGEWAVAYGMHPAVLEYNGISTLDGYLGFYSQEYKERFRKVIAPALERKENTRIYFDDWGARCYLYSGTDDTIVMATRSYSGVTDNDIYIDTDALADLSCSYIFSRIELSNATEKGLFLKGVYEDATSPYKIYVYGVNN